MRAPPRWGTLAQLAAVAVVAITVSWSEARATPPPSGKDVSRSFDAAAARRGRTVFAGTARCASCHSGATPLRAVGATPASLAAVVEHYDATLKLKLGAEQKKDLVEYLKSI